MEKKLSTNQRLKQVKPIQVWALPDRSWVWEIYRFYNRSLKRAYEDPYARVFCRVLSPFVGYERGELGDVYFREIRDYAQMVFDEADGGEYDRQSILKE